MADFAPHNMTSNTSPAPYVASASSTYFAAAPYAAFDGISNSAWQGVGSGVDWLQLDLGGSDFAPHNMTSNTSPSPYVIAASSVYSSGGGDSYLAFNGSVGGFGTYWLGQNAGVDWLSIDLGSGNAKVLGSYQVQVNTVPEPNRAPKNWTMEGSNNGSSWTVLDTQTNQTSWTNGQTRSYSASGSTAYRYFRLNITANNGDATYTQVAELYLNAPSSTAKVLRAYDVAFSSDGSEPLARGPKNWTMQGSNDASTWTTVDAQTNQTSWTTGQRRSYVCGSPSGTAFRYWRINITANNGDATYTTIAEMYLYDTATVQQPINFVRC